MNYIVEKSKNNDWFIIRKPNPAALTTQKFYAGTDYIEVIQVLKILNADNRVNIEQREDGLYLCAGLHSKNEPCNYTRYISYSKEDLELYSKCRELGLVECIDKNTGEKQVIDFNNKPEQNIEDTVAEFVKKHPGYFTSRAVTFLEDPIVTPFGIDAGERRKRKDKITELFHKAAAISSGIGIRENISINPGKLKAGDVLRIRFHGQIQNSGEGSVKVVDNPSDIFWKTQREATEKPGFYFAPSVTGYFKYLEDRIESLEKQIKNLQTWPR